MKKGLQIAILSFCGPDGGLAYFLHLSIILQILTQALNFNQLDDSY